ncbi:MAG: hypothetical protein U0Z26_01805 [Anaerolineales bacterium]
MKINFTSLKWIGVAFTLFLITIAFDPNIFHVPFSARPWLFITNIAWLLMMSSGIFS